MFYVQNLRISSHSFTVFETSSLTFNFSKLTLYIFREDFIKKLVLNAKICISQKEQNKEMFPRF